MQRNKTILDIIGNTPLIQVKNINTGPCKLFLKMECLLPGGSLKDRSALYMINAAEREGKIKPGITTLIEATSGNTALSLALLAAQRNYKLFAVVTDKISNEKLAHLKASGADVIIANRCHKKNHPEYYINLAKKLASEIKDAFYIDQFNNPANPLAHEETTGPEIWAQMEHNLDSIVCAAGSGGHLTGIARYMKKVAPNVKILLADPEGSVVAPFFKTGNLLEKGRWEVEGIGEDQIHSILDLSLVTDAYSISDTESFATVKELFQNEGILAGLSSGTAIAAALNYCRQQSEPKRVVSFVYDSGARYLSKLNQQV